jgi:hypothetical protein
MPFEHIISSISSISNDTYYSTTPYLIRDDTSTAAIVMVRDYFVWYTHHHQTLQHVDLVIIIISINFFFIAKCHIIIIENWSIDWLCWIYPCTYRCEIASGTTTTSCFQSFNLFNWLHFLLWKSMTTVETSPIPILCRIKIDVCKRHFRKYASKFKTRHYKLR